jgi:hypothetical protein
MKKMTIEQLESTSGASRAKDIISGACAALTVARAAAWYFSLAFPVSTGVLVVAGLGCVAAATFMD